MCFVPTWAVLTGWLWHVPTRFYGLRSIFWYFYLIFPWARTIFFNMVAKRGGCRKGHFFAEMAFTHVGAECVGGPWDFEGFLFFLMHPTIHPYSKLRKALSCGSIHNHFVRSATGQKQSEQSNFLFSCTVSTAVQAVKLALCVCLLKYSFSESKSAGFKL